jgi:hypothetical protein
LKAEGTLRPDYGRISALVRTLTDRKLTMKGTDKVPFSVDTSLADTTLESMLRKTAASADFQVKRADMWGLKMEELSLDIAAEKGKARCGVKGGINGGQLDINPVLRLQDGRPVMVIPEESTFITGLRLQEGALMRVLSRGIPVFRDAVQPEGVVDVTVEKAHVGLETGAARNASGSARVSLRDVKLNSSGVLRPVTQFAGLSRNLIKLPDQEVSLSLEKGALQQSPMKLNVGGQTLELSGSVGLDRSLDLQVELPITGELVGNEAILRFLEGRRVTAGIRGTLDNPRLQKDVLRENLQKLTPASPFDLFNREE